MCTLIVILRLSPYTLREFVGWVILPPVCVFIALLVVLASTDVLVCIYEVFFSLIILLELPLLPLFICAIVLLIRSCVSQGKTSG